MGKRGLSEGQGSEWDFEPAEAVAPRRLPRPVVTKAHRIDFWPMNPAKGRNSMLLPQNTSGGKVLALHSVRVWDETGSALDVTGCFAFTPSPARRLTLIADRLPQPGQRLDGIEITYSAT